MAWPHAPARWVIAPGLYMVTAGTYGKAHFLNPPARRDFFQERLFAGARESGWELQAWAILSNHYHFVGQSGDNPDALRVMINKLHMTTAKHFNLWDDQPGSRVWYQYWDTQLTFPRSYLARLNYVHNNPSKHGVAANAADYPWCSAAWFAENATAAVRATVASFSTEALNVPDDF